MDTDTPTGSCVWMLSHQGVTRFERIRRVKKCSLVGGGVSVGWDWRFPKPMTSLASLSPPVDQGVARSSCSSVTPVTMLPR